MGSIRQTPNSHWMLSKVRRFVKSIVECMTNFLVFLFVSSGYTCDDTNNPIAYGCVSSIKAGETVTAFGADECKGDGINTRTKNIFVIKPTDIASVKGPRFIYLMASPSNSTSNASLQPTPTSPSFAPVDSDRESSLSVAFKAAIGVSVAFGAIIVCITAVLISRRIRKSKKQTKNKPKSLEYDSEQGDREMLTPRNLAAASPGQDVRRPPPPNIPNRAEGSSNRRSSIYEMSGECGPVELPEDAFAPSELDATSPVESNCDGIEQVPTADNNAVEIVMRALREVKISARKLSFEEDSLGSRRPSTTICDLADDLPRR